MNNNRLLTTLILTVLATLSAYAQGWQVGGGSRDNNTSINTVQSSGEYAAPGQQYKYNLSLFNGGYDDAPYGFAISYINKEWVTDFSSSGGKKYREDLWGREGKRLHGVQMGFDYSPSFPFGLGLHTGFFYELCVSRNSEVYNRGGDDFTEHSFYIPVHAMLRIPFTNTMSLNAFGGIGINWAFYNAINERYRVYDYIYHTSQSYSRPLTSLDYGTDGWPKRFNLQAEVGGKLRIKAFFLAFTYSWGLTNHRFYTDYDGRRGDFKTVQNKMSVSLGMNY